MVAPRSACHLIFFLVLLSTCYSFTSATRLLGREVENLDGGSSTRNAADHDPRNAASGVGHRLNSWGSWVSENYCYPCGNMAGIVISLPVISLPGLLSIGLPPISIGRSGIQIGGYQGIIGYIPGYGYTTYSVCCVPIDGFRRRGRLFAATPDPHSGLAGSNPGVENEMQRQEGKGHSEMNPKTETRKHGSEGYEVDKHVVKPKMHVGKRSSTNGHGDGGHGEHKKAQTMPPVSS